MHRGGRRTPSAELPLTAPLQCVRPCRLTSRGAPAPAPPSPFPLPPRSTPLVPATPAHQRSPTLSRATPTSAKLLYPALPSPARTSFLRNPPSPLFPPHLQLPHSNQHHAALAFRHSLILHPLRQQPPPPPHGGARRRIGPRSANKVYNKSGLTSPTALSSSPMRTTCTHISPCFSPPVTGCTSRKLDGLSRGSLCYSRFVRIP
jgi:hypothetical protein